MSEGPVVLLQKNPERIEEKPKPKRIVYRLLESIVAVMCIVVTYQIEIVMAAQIF